MNPLSPFTYYRRHKGQALLLVSLITLATLSIYIIVGLLESFMDNGLALQNYLSRFSLVLPVAGPALDPSDVAQIQTHPDVARVIHEKSVYVSVPSLVELDRVRLMGVSEADLSYLMGATGLRLKEGRLLHARTNEFMVSDEIARGLHLRLGDRISRSIDERYYRDIPTELVLVGILESVLLKTERGGQAEPGLRLGLVSLEYLDSHKLYASLPSGLIVVAKEGQRATVEQFLETAALSKRTDVETWHLALASFENSRRILRLIFGVVNVLVAVVVALVVAVINQINLEQRLEEFGVLHAVGYAKNRLIRRVTMETAVVTGIGWLIGLTSAWLLFAWLKANLYQPRGIEMNLANLAPFWFVLPIPLAVIAFVAAGIARVFARLDAVAIVERGQMSLETLQHSRAARHSSPRPLSSRLFYLRHRRRGLMLVVTMALMILGVAFPVFVTTPMLDSQKPFTDYLRRISVVSLDTSSDPNGPLSGGDATERGMVSQIRTHPAVARVIPDLQLGLWISVPPLGRSSIPLHGVSESDLAYLVNLYNVHLKEGRLPRARTNEIAVSEVIALNRDLHVGSRIGRPISDQDRDILTEFVVVGILSPGGLMGFASLEFLQSHELYASSPLNLLVVPVEGRKAELDNWLEKDIASAQIYVGTWGTMLREWQAATQMMFIVFGTIEGVITLVAVIALAILNYIFFAQRQEEFGILNAMGHNRPWLILRVMKETGSIVVVAWLIGAAVCLAAMLYIQVNLYAPKGLRLDLFSPVPWLFTFPIPLAVVAASAITTARKLFKLDLVSIIERR